jgi:tmRNA-binding protein
LKRGRCLFVVSHETRVLKTRLLLCRGAKDLDKKYLEKQKEDEKKIRQAAKAIEIDPK